MNNFFNASALGITPVTSHTQSIAKISTYDKVTFYGQQGCVIDKVYGVNRKLSRDDLNEMATMSFSPKWEPDVYLICEFNNGISGGNIENITSKVKQWLLYRGIEGASVMNLICSLPSEESSYEDYTAAKTHNYKYRLFAQTENEMSAPMDTNDVYCDYYGWFLIDEERGICYPFEKNLNEVTTSQVEEVSEYATNSQYKIYSRGNMDFLSGSVTAIVSDDYAGETQSVGYLEEIREFILSDRPKLIKDNKGRAFRAFVDGYSESDVFVGANGDFKYVTFNFKEIERL